MSVIKAKKQELRRTIRHTLAQLSADSVQKQSQRVFDTICSTTQYRNAGRICVYLAMEGRELQTRDIVHDAFDSGKKVFVPYIYKHRETSTGPQKPFMDMLALHSYNDFVELKKDSWGIPTLSEASLSERENCLGGKGLSNGASMQQQFDMGDGLDLILMPGLAFDQRCNRLGHGKGFYDSFLSKYYESVKSKHLVKMPTLIALALKEQILPAEESVPISSLDWPVEAVAMGNGDILLP